MELAWFFVIYFQSHLGCAKQDNSKKVTVKIGFFIILDMAKKIQDDNEKLQTFLSDEKNSMEEMLQNGLDQASQACCDTNATLRNDLSQLNDKLQSDMSEVNDRLTEQKNDQEKLMNNLTVLTDDLTDTIKDLESKNDQKLQGISPNSFQKQVTY